MVLNSLAKSIAVAVLIMTVETMFIMSLTKWESVKSIWLMNSVLISFAKTTAELMSVAFGEETIFIVSATAWKIAEALCELYLSLILLRSVIAEARLEASGAVVEFVASLTAWISICVLWVLYFDFRSLDSAMTSSMTGVSTVFMSSLS